MSDSDRFNQQRADGEAAAEGARERDSGQEPKSDEVLLQQCRDDFRYYQEYWRPIFDEAEIDRRFAAGDAWDDADRDKRKGRPCLTPDELGQYINQANNNLRQNKRAIKVLPAGEGATDDNAELRAAIIRGIEYRSNAQAAYTTGFESMVECSLGAARINLEYVEGKHLEPRIRRIPNALTVLMDPNAKEADFSDADGCFVTDVMRKSEFARKYPKAQMTNFSPADMAGAPEWFHGDNIVVAEWWRRYHATDEAKETSVVQYITNGVEILERNEWVGDWIPVLLWTGKERYVNDGGGSKRTFESMIRKARTPQKMLAFIASQEAEEFAMAPRAPIILWEGQELADKDAWDHLHDQPRAYVRLRMAVDPQTGAAMPPPERHPFTPNAQAYEISRESWRRAIQASMGITPLPTAAQRRNEKSGIALKEIGTQESVGSFHFTDNHDRVLENAGRQLDQLITRAMTGMRHVPVRMPDDTHSLLRINDPKFAAENPDEDHLSTSEGTYGVTISTGPSYQSQRDESSAFTDLLVTNLPNIPPPSSPPAKILAKAIRLKNLGPIGDQLADILDPQQDDPIPPQAQAKIQELTQQLQALHALAAQLQQEKQAKVTDNEYKLQQERIRAEVDILKAEITTKAQKESERDALFGDMWKVLQGMAHERGMQASEQMHERGMAEAGHQQALEQQQQSGEQAMQQQQQAQEASTAEPAA